MKLSVYATFARLVGYSTSTIEADSDLKRLAELYAEWSKKNSDKGQLGWQLAFPLARYPQLRKLFV